MLQLLILILVFELHVIKVVTEVIEMMLNGLEMVVVDVAIEGDDVDVDVVMVIVKAGLIVVHLIVEN